MTSKVPQSQDSQRSDIRFIRNLDAEPKPRRDALLTAVESMLDDDSELRRPA